jgi:hypothetical protein
MIFCCPKQGAVVANNWVSKIYKVLFSKVYSKPGNAIVDPGLAHSVEQSYQGSF